VRRQLKLSSAGSSTDVTEVSHKKS
jgi:hypothetical protein